MDKNERIAEWLGATSRNDYQTIPADGTLAFTSDCWTPGNRPIIFRYKVSPGLGYAWIDWEPDTNITLWHGPDGLLEEIVKRDKVWLFSIALMDVLDCPRDTMQEWYLTAGARATAAQLATALVKMIEDSE